MLLSIVRTLILYLLTMACIRFMGKRQIGQLTLSDMVSTILISNLASVPVEETNLPFIPAIAPILLITSVEVLLTHLQSKNGKIAHLVSGRSVPVIIDGKILQSQLKDLRFSIDDLIESLRQKDIFDINDVQAAIVEPSGQLTVYKNKNSKCPAAVITDGKVNLLGLTISGKTEGEIISEIENNGLNKENIALLQIKDDEYTTILKDSDKKHV